MKSEKIFRAAAFSIICLMVFGAGCTSSSSTSQVPKETGTFALKFTPQESNTYHVTTESEKLVKFEGSLAKSDEFKDGRNDTRVEMTFTQDTESVDDKGNAIAKITIRYLKYISIEKNNTVMDFDSSREQDKNAPLSKLIGQSYKIQLAPTGEVLNVVDVSQAKAVADETGLKLLQPGAIKERHGTIILPAADKNQLAEGDTWNSLKVFSFGFMGSKPFEKIYTVKSIREMENHKNAFVDVNAVPTSKIAKELYKEEASNPLAEKFDNTGGYMGHFRFDLTSGKFKTYLEKLSIRWDVVDPAMTQEADKAPDAIKMEANRIYIFDKIN